MAAPIGNKNAAKGRLWAKAIERAVARLESGDLDKGLERLAQKLVASADIGDPWALKEIGDRTDGKAAQALLLSGAEEGSAVQVTGRIALVRPDR